MKKFSKIACLFIFLLGVFLGPISPLFAQTTTPSQVDFVNSAAANGEVVQDYSNRLLDCSITNGQQIVACFVWAFYYLVLYPSGKFAEVTAALLDFFISYSLDSNSYVGNSGQFIEKGWGILRDIANISFIFILLYIAIRHILQTGSSNTKKMLIGLIIAALLINFSMFFSKVIIDGGNILARVFYNSIEITNPPPDQPGDDQRGKAISQAITEPISPQKILSSKLFESGNVNISGQARGKMPNGYAFFILAVAAFVNIFIGITFLSTFLLFAARTIGLWFMIIFSPIAFASLAIGGGGNFLGQFGWDSWKNNILKLSFMAPIFIFFLYLALMFLQIALAQNNPTNEAGSDTQILMGVLIPFVVVIVILRQAKKVAGDLAGEFGKALTGVVSKLATFAALGAGAAVIGTAAVAGRAVIGRAGAAIADSEGSKKLAAKNALFRNAIYKPADKASKASMDIRNTGLGRRSGQLLNSTLKEAGFGAWSAGKGTTKGGYVQRVEAYQKEKEAFKEQLRASDSSSQTVHVDANGNVFSKEQTDKTTGQVLTKPITKSLVQAETEFLRVQNEAKRDNGPRDITYVDPLSGRVMNLGTESLDYDGWTKKKEKSEKALTEAKSDYAIILRDFKDGRATQRQLDDATMGLANARGMVAGVKNVIDNIEANWKKEEKLFKGVQKAKNQHDTEMLRTYSESVKPGALNTIYDMAVATGGREARKAASANIGLAAEKEEKKAIAAEKKDDKH